MMTLELNEDELKQIDYDIDKIRKILVSRAIYNESYNYDFTKEQLADLKFLEDNAIVNLYMQKTVEPRVVVNENTIIDNYNENKEFFESKNIPFTEAREIIKENLNREVNYGLEQDLVYNLVHNMEESVSLKKEDILFTKGDPNMIKSVLLNALLRQEANKKTFFEDYKEQLDTLKKEVRINYFVNLICRKDIEITEEKVSRYYVDNSKQFENIDLKSAYEYIFNFLFEKELNEKTNAYIESIRAKYNLEDEISKYKRTDEVLN